MDDARRWRDAMRALGLEWCIGMADDDGAVCVPWGDILGFVDCVNGDTPINHIGGTEDVAVGSGGTEYSLPDPHHPSNLGHLLDMVCEVYGSPDVHTRPNAHGWRAYCPMRKELGTGDTAPLALLDALERKAREVAE